MNEIPLLKSKLAIPELPVGALLTNRIKSLPISGKRASFIVAPGGFGKTTAIILALKEEREHIQWYRLEKEDAFLPVFYTHLIDTLFKNVEKTTLESYRGLNDVRNLMEEYALVNALICQDAWEHFPAGGPQCYIVFDDYQNVADNTLIAESIRYFIENMPDKLSVIISSRVEPGIYSDRLTLNQNITRISEGDLLFTRDETQKLFHGVYKIKASKQDLDAVFTSTEGWIAGLYLLSRMENPFQKSVAQKLNRQTGDQVLFSYFFDSFLKNIMPENLEALAHISIFPEFSRDELEQVLEIKNSGELLGWIESNNMYIQKFDAQPAKYRFHSLFRNELEIYLSKIRTSEEINALYLKTARYYEKLGNVEDAIRFFIAAGSTDSAVNVVRTVGSHLFANGQVEKIMYYTNDFPESIVGAEPYLLFYKGCMLLTVSVEEAYDCFLSALLMFRQKGDMPYLMNAFGMILVISYQTNEFKYANESIKHVPMLRIMLSKGAPRKKLIIAAFIRFVADERLKISTMLSKIIERMSIPEPLWEYCFYTIRCLMLSRVGRLDAAKDNYHRVMNHPICQSSDQWRYIGLVGCHNAILLRGDFEAETRIFDEFASLGEKYDFNHCRAYAYNFSSYMKYRYGDIRGSIEDDWKNVDRQKQYGSVGLASVAKISAYFKESLLDHSISWAEKAEAEFVNITKKNSGFRYELSIARLGCIYKNAGELGRAGELLTEAWVINKKRGCEQYKAMLAMHLSDLNYLKGDSTKSEKHLKKALALCEEYDYVCLSLVDRFTLIRCCALAMQKGIIPDRVSKIMRYYFGDESALQMAQNLKYAAECPQEYAERFTKPQHIDEKYTATLFGKFTITHNGVTISDDEWKTRKISGILKYMLAAKGKYVTREKLAAVFWPDSGAKAASTSLRVALSEMRKCFAAHGMSFDDEFALIIESKNGFCVNDKILLETDADEFEELYKRINKQTSDDEGTAAALENMIGLYNGDFLTDRQYDDWTSLRREHCRSLFIEASFDLLEIHMRREKYKEAEELLMKLLYVDPLNDKACGTYVQLCKLTGQNDRAESFLNLFEKRFYDEIGVMPDITA